MNAWRRLASRQWRGVVERIVPEIVFLFLLLLFLLLLIIFLILVLLILLFLSPLSVLHALHVRAGRDAGASKTAFHESVGTR